MTTEKKIEANRKNSQKSTGPKTKKGKEISCQNSIKHGLLSKTLVIKGESSDSYEVFRNGVYDDLQPMSAMETLLVEKLVNYAWRLRRAVQAETILLEDGLNDQWSSKKLDSFFSGFEAKKIQNISRYESTIEKHFYRSLKELREIQQIRKESEQTRDDDHLFGFGFVS